MQQFCGSYGFYKPKVSKSTSVQKKKKKLRIETALTTILHSGHIIIFLKIFLNDSFCIGFPRDDFERLGNSGPLSRP